MANQFRTASGQVIDMEALRLKNEHVIAVGNMRVNARGDELGAGGLVVKDRNQRVDEHYKSQSKSPVETPVYADAKAAVSALTADVLPPTVTPTTTAIGGIAGALAAAAQSKDAQ